MKYLKTWVFVVLSSRLREFVYGVSRLQYVLLHIYSRKEIENMVKIQHYKDWCIKFGNQGFKRFLHSLSQESGQRNGGLIIWTLHVSQNVRYRNGRNSYQNSYKSCLDFLDGPQRYYFSARISEVLGPHEDNGIFQFDYFISINDGAREWR